MAFQQFGLEEDWNVIQVTNITGSDLEQPLLEMQVLQKEDP